MDCVDFYYCVHPPSLPPPPPLPAFMADFISFNNRNNDTLQMQSCDLCSWASPLLEKSENSLLSLTSLLVIVAIASGLIGSLITGAVLSFKRLRNRKFEESPDAVRHLSRKCNDSANPAPSSASSFTTTVLSENTYCEGPYNDKDTSNNIYAELHSGNSGGIWSRPPIPPPAENCYLELNDLQETCRQCTPQQSTSEYSPPSSAYYSDLDMGRHVARPL